MHRDWVDRVDELVNLRNWWEATPDTRKGVLVTGEAGVGKTFLVSRFLEDLRLSNEFVPLSFDFDANLTKTAAPLAFALSKLYSGDGLLSYKVKTALKKVLPEVLHESPVVGRMIGKIVSRGMSFHNADIQDLLQSSEYALLQIVRACRRIAAKMRVVVVLDNLQWIDQLSYVVVKHLIDNPSEEFLFVSGMRTENLCESSNAMSRARRLLQALNWDEIRLSPFDEATVSCYMEMVMKEPPSLDRVRDMTELTGGLPLLVSCLAQTQTNIKPPSDKRGRSFSFVNIALSTYFQDKLDLLNALEVLILRTCAAHDSSLPISVLFEAIRIADSSQTRETIAFALHDLQARHMLVFENAGHVQFRHRLLSEFLYAQLSSSLARNIHKYLSDAFKESTDLETNPTAMFSLARHLRLSGNYSDSARWLLRTAEEHMSIGIPLNAWTAIEELASLDLSGMSVDVSAEYKHLAIKCCYALGEFKRAVSICAELPNHEIAELSGQGLLDTTYFHEAMSYYYLNESQSATASFARAASSAKSSGNSWIYNAAQLGIAACLDLQGNYIQAQQVFNDSRDAAINEGDDYLVAKFDLSTQMITNDPTITIQRLKSAHLAFQQIGDSRNIAAALNNIGLEFLMQGELGGAEQKLRASIEEFRRVRGLEVNFPLNNLGILLRYKGEFERSKRSLELAASGGLSLLQRAFALTNLGVTLYEMGERDSAEKYLQQAYELSNGHADPTTRIYTSFNLAKYYYLCGQEKECMRLLLESLEGPWKDQLQCLVQKRVDLARLCGLSVSSKKDSRSMTSGVRRRQAFIKDIWEPAELVFFS